MAANKKHTAKVAWFERGKYCWKLFNNISEATEWAGHQTFTPSYIGEASWSEHKIYKQEQKPKD